MRYAGKPADFPVFFGDASVLYISVKIRQI